jgi:O-antigen/teichoic acid export membrane protein
MGELKRKAFSGVMWNTFTTVTDSFISIIRIAIVARFIAKSDFGLLAIVSLVIEFTGLFRDMGLTTAILHKQDITTNQYSSLYWFNWVLNIVIYLLVIAASPFVASFYNEPRLIILIIVMGLDILISAWGKIFQTVKTKRLEFGFISKTRIITRFLSLVLVVVFLLMGLKLWSIVFSSLIASFVNSAIFAIAGRKELPIRFYYKFSEIRDFFRIGIYDMGSQILDFVSYKIDILLIGKFFGMDVLGVYNLGKELAMRILSMINPIINKVATPIFALMQNDKNAIKTNYTKIINILTFINFPILGFMFIMAEPIVVFLYGPNMIEVAFFVKVLSFWGMIASIDNPAGVLVVASGRTDLGFKWTIIRVLCAPLAIVIASLFDAHAVAYAQVLLQIFFFAIYWVLIIYPLAHLRMWEYLNATTHALLCTVVAVLAVVGLKSVVFLPVTWSLIAAGTLFSVTYALMTWFLNRNIMTLYKELVKNR